MLNQRPDMKVDDVNAEVVLQNRQRAHLHPNTVPSVNICWSWSRASRLNAILLKKARLNGARDIGSPVRDNLQETVCHWITVQ